MPAKYSMTEFEDALMALIDEYRKNGLSDDEILSVFELREMAIREEALDE